MSWKRKKRPNKYRRYSIVRKLRDDGRLNEDFELLINSLSLEEVIAVKLELATKHMNGKMYGFPVWIRLRSIITDAVLKFAISATSSKFEAASFLGTKPATLFNLTKKYKITSYFGDE